MHTGMFTGPLAQSVHAYPTWSLAIQQTVAQFVGRYRGRAARPPLSPAPPYFAAPGNRRAGETGLAGRVHRRRCGAVLASDAVSDRVEGAVPGGSERDDAAIPVGLDTGPPLAVQADLQDVRHSARGSAEPDFHAGLPHLAEPRQAGRPLGGSMHVGGGPQPHTRGPAAHTHRPATRPAPTADGSVST